MLRCLANLGLRVDEYDENRLHGSTVPETVGPVKRDNHSSRIVGLLSTFWLIPPG